MNAVAALLSSTVGKKVLMAFTGLVMLGWLCLHTTGNLLVFAGEESFNHYAAWIQSGFGVEPALLWALRAFMLWAMGSHVWAAITLTRRNRDSRPAAYAAGRKDLATKQVAHFMALGGVTILLYLVFHILHLTVGSAHPDFQHGNAYRNLVIGLSNPLVCAFYLAANGFLGAHLYHGVVSGFQTLGWNHPSYDAYKSFFGKVLPAYVAGGNLLIATSVLAGLVANPR
jgi:succinate dehydrogenase / fumarate reductase cytochrome b subunit